MTYEEIKKILASGKYRLIAIDGHCASGKTTLGDRLHDELGGNLFHMDDFYLPWALKTEERMKEPGGNVDYERFDREVLQHLLNREDFSYRCFDCGTQSLKEPVSVTDSEINIIEGSYAMHPSLIDDYDLKIYVKCDEKTRLRRIEMRDPEKYEDFVKMWIPLENIYFDTCKIEEKADLVYATDE